MSVADLPPKPKRRWHQFSMRTMLLVMLVFIVTVGGIGSRFHRAKRNRDAMAATPDAVAMTGIKKLGAEVTIAYKQKRPQTWLENWLDDPGSLDDPVRVLNVTKVNLWHSNVTDKDSQNLNGLTALQALNLSYTEKVTRVPTLVE
jgi:hypothetical protein